MKIAHTRLTVVGVPLLFQLVLVGTFTVLFLESRSQLESEMRARETIALSQKLMAEMAAASIASVTYAAIRNPRCLNLFDQADNNIQELLKELEPKLTDSPAQKDNFVAVKTGFSSVMPGLKDTFHKPASLFSAIMTGQAGNADFKKEVDALGTSLRRLWKQEELEAEKRLEARERTNSRLSLLLYGGFLLSSLCGVLLSLMVSRSLLGRLEIVVAKAEKLSLHLPLGKQLGGTDEVADIDRVVHTAGQALAQSERQNASVIALVRAKLEKPLTELKSAIDSLGSLQGQLTDKASNRIGLASNYVDRLLQMVSELLSIEVRSAETFILDPQKISLEELSKRAISLSAVTAEDKNISLRSEIREETFIGDFGLLVQVIVNLLSNAIKYSSPGSAVVLRGRKDADGIRIEVQDHGRGVPSELTSKIFSPFVQVAREDAKVGSGLGLSICREIVALHGGTIGVDSEPGKGSIFWFRIPSVPQGASTVRSSSVRWQHALGVRSLGIVLMPIVLTNVFIVYLALSLHNIDRAIDQERKAIEIIARVNEVVVQSTNLARTAAARLVSSKDKPSAVRPDLSRHWINSEEQLAQLAGLVRGNVEAETLVDELKHACLSINQLGSVEPPAGEFELLGTGMRKLKETIAISAKMKTLADRLMAVETRQERDSALVVQAQFSQLIVVLPLAVVAGLLLTIVSASNFSRQIVARLQRLKENAQRLNKHVPLLAPNDENDEIAQLDRLFHSTAEKLLEHDRFRSYVVEVVSHEMKAPLQTIMGVLHLLSAGAFGELTPPAVVQVELAQRRIAQLMRLIQELLDSKKLEAGTLIINLQDCHIQTLVAQIKSTAEDLFDQCRYKLSVGPIDNDAVAQIDRERVVSILLAIIENAEWLFDSCVLTLDSRIANNLVEFSIRAKSGTPPDQDSLDHLPYALVERLAGKLVLEHNEDELKVTVLLPDHAVA